MKQKIKDNPFSNPEYHHDFCGCNVFYDNPICVERFKKLNPSAYYRALEIKEGGVKNESTTKI